jgi:hypothetical protein
LLNLAHFAQADWCQAASDGDETTATRIASIAAQRVPVSLRRWVVPGDIVLVNADTKPRKTPTIFSRLGDTT